MNRFISIIYRDLNLALRQGGATLLVVVFFILTVSLFPLGVGPDPGMLKTIAPGVLWVAALLSAVLSLDRLFQTDYEDGSLEQLVLSGLPLPFITLAKIIAHWFATGVPLILAAPLLALFFGFEMSSLGVLIGSMAIGTPILSLLGSVCAALTVALPRGGILLSLLVLPLCIPVLIFGVAAVNAVSLGLTPRPHILLLIAFLITAIPLCPLVAAAALKLSLD